MTTTTRRSRSLKVAVAGGVAALLLGATAAPAFAASASAVRRPPAVAAPSLDSFRRICNYEIDRRLFILTIADNWISSARHLTDDQRSSMLASNAAVLDHLQTVNRPAVAAAPDAASLRAACDAIFTDNRVYAVVIPQLLLTIRVDQLTDGLGRLGALSTEKAAAGYDTAQVDAWLTQASAELVAAEALVAGVTVDSFNADPAAARTAFDDAQAHIAVAFGEVLQSLRALGAMHP